MGVKGNPNINRNVDCDVVVGEARPPLLQTGPSPKPDACRWDVLKHSPGQLMRSEDFYAVCDSMITCSHDSSTAATPNPDPH